MKPKNTTFKKKKKKKKDKEKGNCFTCGKPGNFARNESNQMYTFEN
jgi:hypothetical protein